MRGRRAVPGKLPVSAFACRLSAHQSLPHTIAALPHPSPCASAPQLPTADEISAHLSGRPLKAIVFFLDETFEELAYDITTSVLEAVQQVSLCSECEGGRGSVSWK